VRRTVTRSTYDQGVQLRSARRYFWNLLACFGLLYLLVTITPVDLWWARQLAGEWKDPKGDTLIVLGGSALEDGTMGLNSYWRAVYATRAFPEGFQRIVITGGAPPGSSPVATGMRDFLMAKGIAASAITVETDSHNTRENAVNVSRLLGSWSGVNVLMTSDLHMFRAHRAFKKAGLVVLARPFPDAIKRYSSCVSCRWEVFLELNLESAKILYYVMRGWI
jgi:uncharacterized SAM-binding protein YcdF (DUF218 family)